MLYVKSRKSLRGRREKKFIYLPSAKKNTRQTCFFAECQKNNTRQSFVRRVSEKNTRQTSKLPSIFFFAECFLCNTRQKCCFPGARGMTLDKPSNTWHLWDFP